MTDKPLTKVQQAEELHGRQGRDTLEPIRSAILIAKWNAKSYDDPTVERVWIRKAEYATLDQAAQALTDVQLPSGLDFTQYGRGNYDFADFSELVGNAAVALATGEVEAQAPVTRRAREQADHAKADRVAEALLSTPDAAQRAADLATATNPTEEVTVSTKKSTPKKAVKAATPTGDGLRWPEGERRCPRCEATKPRSDFASNKSSKDGAFSICKECEKADRKRLAERKAAAKAEAGEAPAPAAPKASAKKAPASATPMTVSHKRLPGQTFDTSEALNAALDALDKAEEAVKAVQAEVEAPVKVPAKAPKAKGNTARTRKAAQAAAKRQAELEAAEVEVTAVIDGPDGPITVIADGTPVQTKADVAQAIADRLA